MFWQQLLPVWQICFEEAWTAYCHGSLPHGAVVTDAEGTILGRGRNGIRGTEDHSPIAHAELRALMNVDWDVHQKKERHGYALYSTIEPCIMCAGAVLMAHTGHIHYASGDPQTGAHQLATAPLFQNQPFVHDFTMTGPQDPLLETILVALQLDAVLHMPPMPMKQAWAEQIAATVPAGGQLGTQLYEMNILFQWKNEQQTAAFVYDQMARLLNEP